MSSERVEMGQASSSSAPVASGGGSAKGTPTHRGGGPGSRGSFGDDSGTPPANYNLPALVFHARHGENVVLSPGREKARRSESFCKGIVFSDRPVMVRERVSVRLLDLDRRWNGMLRVGFSAHDPDSLPRPLPKYACPDLTSKQGFWAKALSERCVESGAVVHYYVTAGGDVHFGINGRDLGVFFTDVDTRNPLWAMVDLYGNCTSIEFVDVRTALNNFASGGRSPPPVQQRPPTELSEEWARQALHNVQQEELDRRRRRLQLQQDELERGQRLQEAQELQRRQQQQQDQRVPPALPPAVQASPPAPSALSVPPEPSAISPEPLRFNNASTFRTGYFHPSCGRNAVLVDPATAARHEEEFSQGYVFTRQTVVPGERLVVKVLGTELSYIGSLAFGLTNCDPGTIDVRELPEDSDLLLDRPEYWVVSKDVGNSPDVGDELSFSINADGSVEFSKNGNNPTAFVSAIWCLREF